MALPQEVTAARQEALRDGAGEEDGGEQEERHVANVEPQHRLLLPGRGGGGEAVDHGAHDQQVGQAGGNQGADPAGWRVRTPVVGLGDAAAGAGEPRQESGAGEIRPAERPLPPLRLRGVEIMSQRRAVLVDRHTDVVQEEHGVMRDLGAGLQQVGRHAAGQIGEHGRREEAQGKRREVPGVPQGSSLGPPAYQQSRRGEQVRPDVEGLVVPLEHAEEVAVPVLANGTVARQDVGLSEQDGDLGGGDWELGAGPAPLHIQQEVGEMLRHPGNGHGGRLFPTV